MLSMTATLTIVFSDDVLDALRKAGSLQIQMAGGRNVTAPGDETPRHGSLPARILDWARARGKPFGAAEVVKQFKLSRAHASMLLSKLANGPYGVEKPRRGVYAVSGAPSTSTKRRTKTRRK